MFAAAARFWEPVRLRLFIPGLTAAAAGTAVWLGAGQLNLTLGYTSLLALVSVMGLTGVATGWRLGLCGEPSPSTGDLDHGAYERSDFP